MDILAIYFALLGISVLAALCGRSRALYVTALPLLALDCAVNALLGSSWRKTLSGEAWYHRDHPYWWWCQPLIDRLFFFQPDHCRNQAIGEARYGSAWALWRAEFAKAK